MRELKRFVKVKQITGNIYEKKVAKTIILNGSKILLKFSKIFNDYSLPACELKYSSEAIEKLGLEIEKISGETDFQFLGEFGSIEEYRPIDYPQFDAMHVNLSIYRHKINNDFDEEIFEKYDTSNGLIPLWIDIEVAIRHNKVMIDGKHSDKGHSIERETYLLELIKKELV